MNPEILVMSENLQTPCKTQSALEVAHTKVCEPQALYSLGLGAGVYSL